MDGSNVPFKDSSIEELLDGVVLENLSLAMANKMSDNFEKVHKVVQYEFQNKNS